MTDCAAGDPLTPFCDYEGLIDALRAQKERLGLSDSAVDELSGMPLGYTGKVLGPSQARNLGPASFGLLLQTLCLRLAPLEDAEQLAKLKARFEQKTASQARFGHDAYTMGMNSRAVKRVLPLVFKGLAQRMTEGRKKISPRKRRALARAAAKKRWEKQRQLQRRRMRARRREPRCVSKNANP